MSDQTPAKTREQLLQDWLLADTKELFETAKSLIAEGVAAQAAITKAASEIRAASGSTRESVSAVERTLTKYEERLGTRLKGFEASLVTWAASYRMKTLLLVALVAFVASLAGSIAGGFILPHLH